MQAPLMQEPDPSAANCEGASPTDTGGVSIPVSVANTDLGQHEPPSNLTQVDNAPAVMIPRNRWTQYKALMQKHVNSYTRQKEVLQSEIFTTILYAALLFVFGLTSSVQKVESNAPEWYGNVTVTTSHDLQTMLPFDAGFSQYCSTGSCYLAFADVEEGNGCSEPLVSFMQRFSVCAFSSSPTFSANNSAFKAATGSNFVSCKCIKPRDLRDYARLQAERIGGAVEFTSLPNSLDSTVLYNYTIHLTTPSVDAGTPAVESPLLNEDAQAGQIAQAVSGFSRHPLALQLALDSAILEGTSIAVGIAEFPQPGSEFFRPGALGNVPFYCTFLMFISLQGLTAGVAEEGKKGLSHSLFMVGLSPTVYWAAWFSVLGAKQAVISLLVFLILGFGVSIPNVEPAALLIPILLIALWSIQFAVFLGLWELKPKTASGILLGVPAMFSIIPTILAFNPQASGLPGQVHLVLAFVMPSYAYSATLMQLIVLSAPVYGGFSVRNFGVQTNMGFRVSEMLLALLVGNAVMAILIWWRFWSTFGMATSKSKPSARDAQPQAPAAAGETPAVSIWGLRKGWGGFTAVDGLSVDFYEGQITAFLGHNGAGKSTTIKLLTGLYSADGGDALVAGRSIVQEMGAVRELIGVCPQENVLWDFLTVQEHMEFFADVLGVSPHSRGPHIHALLAQVGLGSKAGDLSKSLSGGMKRKLMLAMALTGDPKVLFLDEPTAGMDSGARRDVWSLLLRKRAGRSIVMCTHYMDEADILGDRIAVIHAGRLQDAGSSAELKIKYGRHVRLQMTLSAGADRRALLGVVAGCVGENAAQVDTSDVFEDDEVVAQAAAEALESREAGDLTLLLPMDADMAGVLEALQEARERGEMGLEDFSVMAPTLTDVFWELEQLAAAEDDRAQQPGASLGNERGRGAGVTLAELVRAPARGVGAMAKVWVLLGRQTTTWVREASEWSGVPLPLREVFYAALLTVALLLTMIDFIPARPAPATVSLAPASAFADVGGRVGVVLGAGAASGPGQAVVAMLGAWAEAPRSSSPVPVDGAGLAPCPLAALIGIEDSAWCSADAESKVGEVPMGELEARAEAPGGFVATLDFGEEGLTLQGSDPAMPVPDASAFDLFYVVRPNASVLASVQGVVSLVDGAAYHAASGAGAERPAIETNFETLASEATSEEATERLNAQLDLMMAQLKGIMLFAAVLPLNNVIAEIARKVVLEKALSIKQLQTLMGVTPTEYFAAKMIWDYLWMVSVFVVPVTVACVLPASPLGSPATVLLFLAFPAAVIPLVYAIVRDWEDAEYATSRVQGVCFIVFLLTFFPYFVLAIPAIVEGIEVSPDALAVIRVCLALWPTTALALGLRAVILADAYGYDALAARVSASDLKVQDEITAALFGKELPIETALAPLLVLLAEALLFVWLPPLLERGGSLVDCCGEVCFRLKDMACRCVCLDCCWGEAAGTVGKGEIQLDAQDVEDEDVQAERRAVDAMEDRRPPEQGLVNSMDADSTLEEGEARGDGVPAVLLSHVRKQYRPSGMQRYEGTTAVHDLCLRIKRRECFALLGTNGAGKTTTLNMIMRQLSATAGDIKVNGQSIHGLGAQADAAFKSFGFCPQHNALFDSHTTREMITFYARIRGIESDQLGTYVESWLLGCKLMANADTQCGKLSGGNKRKLSLAMAILGNPDLAVLDEPSAGVDPAARRQLHRIINGVKSMGSTIILTTHHMAEAAALGNRIAIMVQGRMACLGSPGHLLNAYSEGYAVTVCMTAGRSVQDAVLPLLRERCPGVAITNLPSEEYVAANLGGAESFSVVALYRSLEEMRRAGAVSFFSCGKSTLENVFLRFAKMPNIDSLLADDNGGVGDDGQGRAAERGGEEWGAELYLNSASKVTLELTEKLDFGCLFGRCGGLNKFAEQEWFASVPERLKEKGVTEAEWAHAMEGLQRVQRLSARCDPMRGLHCCLISVTISSYGWACMTCPWSKCDPFQSAMGQWLADFNQVLEPKGIFVKGFTFGKRKTGGAAATSMSQNLSVLVFALSRMEIKRVKDEPVLQAPEDEKSFNCWHCAAHQGRAI